MVWALLLLRFTWARNMSTAGSMWSTKRRPPGSFAHCCSVMPIWIAVHRSMSAWSVTPASASAATRSRYDCHARSIDASDGAKPGIVRWKRSWYRTSSSRQNSVKRREPRLSTSTGFPVRLSSAIQACSSRWPCGEQDVVDGVLGREILVQRGGVEPDPGPELPHRDRGEPVLAGEVPRRGEHVVDRRLPATRPRPKFEHCWNIPTMFGILSSATTARRFGESAGSTTSKPGVDTAGGTQESW